MIHSMTKFAKNLRETNYAYLPLITETIGATNLVIGSCQCVAARIAKCRTSEDWKLFSERHYSQGQKAIKRGAHQFIPGAVIGAYLTGLSYFILEGKNIPIQVRSNLA